MRWTLYLIFFVLLLILELFYFKIADKYNIIDKPNHRSSHTKPTIRGGGIIFPIALLLGWFYTRFEYSYFIAGLLLISFVSFLDDISHVKRRVRITVHLIAVILLFYQLGIYNLPFYWILLGFIFVIGTINAVNFMDGINGITGGYGLITILTLICVNLYIVSFTQTEYLIISALSLAVFNFFNFRIKARCFAGDVGSVSLAFILVFFIMQLIIKTNNVSYVLFLLIYGLDAVSTIIFRLIRKEHIAEAHRTHFYQFLANEKKIPHWRISGWYALIQCVVNVLILYLNVNTIMEAIEILSILFIIFIAIRFIMEGTTRLIRR